VVGASHASRATGNGLGRLTQRGAKSEAPGVEIA
jgi:hypothetical protein